MHLVMSDASGDSAVLEYVKGKLVIHHGKQIKVVTNSPTYDKQLAIMEYWKEAGGLEKSLPGTSRAADRFVRTSYLLDALPAETAPKYISGTPQQSFKFQAPMAVLSLMRSVGTPLGFSLEEQPWVSSTIWRTVSDSTNRVVIFDSAMTPATFWVKLDDLDLRQGAPVKKLELAGGKTIFDRLNGIAWIVGTPPLTTHSKQTAPCGRCAFSRDEADLPLVSDGEDSDLVPRHQEAVQGDVARRTVGNHKFADVGVNAPPQQRVGAKIVDGGTEGLRSCYLCARILFAQRLEGSLQVVERSCRVNYRRHGFGRSVTEPCARRAIQACTSSAR
jgi:hypothetical protein